MATRHFHRQTQKLQAALRTLSRVKPANAEQFAFDCEEFLSASEWLKQHLPRLVEVINEVPRDSRAFARTTSAMRGQCWELRTHLGGIEKFVKKLQRIAYEGPPFNTMSESQLHEFIVQDAKEVTEKAMGRPLYNESPKEEYP